MGSELWIFVLEERGMVLIICILSLHIQMDACKNEEYIFLSGAATLIDTHWLQFQDENLLLIVARLEHFAVVPWIRDDRNWVVKKSKPQMSVL